MEADITVFDEVDSTNTILEHKAREGCPEGTCVVAFSQTKGQGRSGRSFYSPDGGNLYMSFLVRPKSNGSDLLTVIAAVSVVEGIDHVLGKDTGIKWVNDIYSEGKKVCGIIAKAFNAGTADMYVVVGIGINIYESDVIPDDIKDIYASVMKKSCDLSVQEAKDQALMLARFIKDRFFFYHKEGSRSDIIGKYKAKSVVIGRDVFYLSGDSVTKAHVVDIDDEGSIVLMTDDGLMHYRDGEIRIRYTDD